MSEDMDSQDYAVEVEKKILFEFIESEHKYILNGKTLPSVTSLIPFNYIGDNTYQMERGLYLHKAIELYHHDDLIEETLDEVLRPFFEAYKKFQKECPDIQGIIDVKSGSPHPCNALQIAAYTLLVNEGTPIREIDKYPIYEVPHFHSTYGFAGTPDIVTEKPIKKGYILYLKNDSTYRLEEVKDIRKNINVFLSFLTCWKFKKEHNL